MKNILSKTRTAIVLLCITVLLLGSYAYMLARPISYGMGYYNSVVYEDVKFAGELRFNSDGTYSYENTNFDEKKTEYYYYKDGYVFFTLATTDEAYKEEVAWIEANFEEAINTPFYADQINAFYYVASEGDGYSLNYDCNGAVVFAIVAGVVVLMFAGLTATSIVLCKKGKYQE